MKPSDVQRNRLVELRQDECWELAATRPVGRLAWHGREGISVLPVNFVVVDGDILVRTSPYSLLARDCVDREVGFEVDDLDDEQRTGWSVLVHGVCQRERRAADEPTPWATGPRVLGLRIEARSVTGRRLVTA